MSGATECALLQLRQLKGSPLVTVAVVPMAMDRCNCGSQRTCWRVPAEPELKAKMDRDASGPESKSRMPTPQRC